MQVLDQQWSGDESAAVLRDGPIHAAQPAPAWSAGGQLFLQAHRPYLQPHWGVCGGDAYCSGNDSIFFICHPFLLFTLIGYTCFKYYF